MESTESGVPTEAVEAEPYSIRHAYVVPASEHGFDSFGGSLVLIPDAPPLRQRGSEFFMPYETGIYQPAVAPEGPGNSGVEFSSGQESSGETTVAVAENAVADVEEIAPADDAFHLPVEEPGSLESPISVNSDAVADPAEAQPKERVKKAAKEKEGPRFHSPKSFRFFDPVAAAAESEGEDADGAEIVPRPSIELSPELKAAIMQIDEQLRQKRAEHAPAAPKKKWWSSITKRPAGKPEIRRTEVSAKADFQSVLAPPALEEIQMAVVAAPDAAVVTAPEVVTALVVVAAPEAAIEPIGELKEATQVPEAEGTREAELGPGLTVAAPAVVVPAEAPGVVEPVEAMQIATAVETLPVETLPTPDPATGSHKAEGVKAESSLVSEQVEMRPAAEALAISDRVAAVAMDVPFDRVAGPRKTRFARRWPIRKRTEPQAAPTEVEAVVEQQRADMPETAAGSTAEVAEGPAASIIEAAAEQGTPVAMVSPIASVEEPAVLTRVSAPDESLPTETVAEESAAKEVAAPKAALTPVEQPAPMPARWEEMSVAGEPIAAGSARAASTIKAIEAVKAEDAELTGETFSLPVEDAEEADAVRPWLAAARTSVRTSHPGAEQGQRAAASAWTVPNQAGSSQDKHLQIRALPHPFLQALRDKKLAETKSETAATEAQLKAAAKRKAAEAEEAARGKLPLSRRFQRWLDADRPVQKPQPEGRRNGTRSHLPGLVAYYYSGGTPRAYEIENISKTGFYMRTQQLWSPETMVRMTLQRDDLKRSVSILARVVRIDEGGVGHAFVSTEALETLRTRDILPSQGTDLKALEEFLSAVTAAPRPRK